MMWTRQGLAAFVVVGVAMATAAMAAVPGPIDPRYPDYIVNAEVKCVEEGSFPHPKNCSWYYRCVDRLNIGYFFTYYFECEPGTVFADELDQCVHPHRVAPPCGTAGQITQKPVTSPATPTTPTTPTTQTTPTTPTTPTTSITGTTNPSLPCIFNETSCKTYEYCQPVQETKVLCTDGCFASFIHISMKNLCGDSTMLFDNVKKECVPQPKAAELCPVTTTPSPGPVVTTTTTNTLRCSLSDIRPFENWIKDLYCSEYYRCAENGFFLGSVLLCDNFHQCRRNEDGSWSTVLMNCSGGLKYSYDEDKCMAVPADQCLY